MRNEIDKAWSGHPSEEWSAMDQYEKDLKDFLEMMEAKKPDPEDFDTQEGYNKAMAEWNMSLSCDRPNKPGYYRAAND